MQMLEIDRVSREYGVFVGDTLMIALNLFGLYMPGGANRARVEVSLDDAPSETFLVIIPMNRQESPFTLTDEAVLRFGGQPVGRASEPDNDDAIGGYFRKSGRVLTLNPNSRSRCTGCAFCPNTLEAASDPRLRDTLNLHELLDALVHESGGSLSAVEEVTISTGCYEQESRAVDFLASVRTVVAERGMDADIGFLTSVLRTDAAFEKLADVVGPLLLFVTLECFSRRDLLLKSTKASLDADDVPDLLRRAHQAGLRPTYNYVVGLDKLAVMDRLRELDRESDLFPNYQIYQSHNTLMDSIRAPGADCLEYYLAARTVIEKSWADRPIRPESWRNYRPLWYYTFAREALAGPRI